MIDWLYIQPKKKQDLEKVSRRISALLNVDLGETRYSDNAAGGRYQRGKALGLEITLQESDSVSFADYAFKLIFESNLGQEAADNHILCGLVDLIAKYLARNDMKVARPTQPRQTGTSKFEY